MFTADMSLLQNLINSKSEADLARSALVIHSVIISLSHFNEEENGYQKGDAFCNNDGKPDAVKSPENGQNAYCDYLEEKCS